MRLLMMGIILIGYCGGFGCDKSFDPKRFEPPPPRVEHLQANFDTGLFIYDLKLSHDHPWGELTDIELTISLYRQDGEKREVKQYWGTWKPKEVKKVSIPAHRYQKVAVLGSAIAITKRTYTESNGKSHEALEEAKHTIDSSWTWEWKGR